MATHRSSGLQLRNSPKWQYLTLGVSRDKSSSIRFCLRPVEVVVSRSLRASDLGHPQGVGKRHWNRCHQPKIQLTMYQRIGMFHTNQMVLT